MLPLSASHSVVMPSVVKVPLPYMSRPQSMLWDRLPQREGEVSMGADREANTQALNLALALALALRLSLALSPKPKPKPSPTPNPRKAGCALCAKGAAKRLTGVCAERSRPAA